MSLEQHIEIRPAANGYVVFYSEIKNDRELNVEFVAISLDEVLGIVRDLLSQEESYNNLANILDETIPQE
jgi:hypothetical protein